MPAQRDSTCSSAYEASCASQADHRPAASEGASVRLGELVTQILEMADVVKEVQTEVAQLHQANRNLRKHQELAAGQERALRTSASSIDLPVAGEEPTPPAVVEAHAPTEPPPDLADMTRADSGKRRVQLRTNTAEDGALYGELGRFGSFRESASLPVSKSKSHIKREVSESLHRQHTFQPKFTNGVKKKSELAWVSSMSQNDGKGGRPSERHSVADLRALLLDPEALKQRMKDSLTKPDFHVTRLYSTTGYAQKVARSHLFENMTMVIIFLNTIWIAVDTEHNKADVLLDADVGFQIIEHYFCLFFLFELMVRFAAFKQKRDCLRSGWFIFESALVVAMVFEDWVLTLILLASEGGKRSGTGAALIKDVAILRMLRLLRLARLGRAVKLLRHSPEVMVMVKALSASARSVLWTCVLLACLMFFFGVCFTQLCKDSDLENDDYFGSLTSSMHTLFIAGLFPDLEVMSRTINKAHFVYWALFVVYLTMTAISVMNLLIGMLVEVAQASARIERDTMDVAYVKDVFVNTLCLWEVEDFSPITVAQEEFVDLLQEPEILKALTKIGIDVFGLIDLMDFIFMNGPVGFAELLEVVLQLRSSAEVTVKDLVEVRKFLSYEMAKLKDDLTFFKSELTVGVSNSDA